MGCPSDMSPKSMSMSGELTARVGRCMSAKLVLELLTLGCLDARVIQKILGKGVWIDNTKYTSKKSISTERSQPPKGLFDFDISRCDVEYVIFELEAQGEMEGTAV